MKTLRDIAVSLAVAIAALVSVSIATNAHAQGVPVNCANSWVSYTAATHKYSCGSAAATYSGANITGLGVYLNSDGSASAPSYSFASQPTTGLFYGGGASQFSQNGTATVGFPGGGIQIGSGLSLGWSSTSSPLASGDLFLYRDAANTLAQRNGTNAQTFNLYNTYTDASNYERFKFAFTTGAFRFRVENAGSGSARDLDIGTSSTGTVFLTQNNNARWQINPNLTAFVDNTYDIGASGATRPRTGYFGTSVVSTAYNTTTNCSSSAAPAVCAAAAAGSVVIAAAGTTVTVNTTAVTANSQIFITEDSSLGTKLSVTCNTTIARTYAVTARTAATSFTITASAAPVTDPACLSYAIVN